MHFHLTEEQRAIQDAVRGTLADNWPMERIHAFADGEADFDPESWTALMGLGLGAILTPDSGMGLLDAALACEVAGEAAAAGPLTGQLLAGMDPMEAVKYQILLMFLLAGASGLAAVGTALLAVRAITDERDRLRLDRFQAD